EIMGSEGYLINEFIAARTNHRSDDWGGTYEKRMRFPIEIVKRTREVVGENFIIIFRLSMLDLVKGGSSWEEVIQLAVELENAGVTILNTGIGWHEARIPTIATMVPRAAFTWVTHKLKSEVSIPLITSNRINMPDVAENILAAGHADMVSMARPFLADEDLVLKSFEGREAEINTCIACNQACLDHIFDRKTCSCLVNPRACHETELNYIPTKAPKKVAVVGAGPAGLAISTIAAERGHQVTLFEASAEIGGQFNMAKMIPGKEEFHETIRYFDTMIKKHGVDLRLNTRVSPQDLINGKFHEVIVATGVTPRAINLPGIDHEKVLSYVDVLAGNAEVGQRVAIIGAGGIGFDVAEYLTSPEESSSLNIEAFMKEWGVDQTHAARGGVEGIEAEHPQSEREVFLLQRKSGKLGAGLGKTTGWIHRSSLKNRHVKMIGNVQYEGIDDQGLHILIKGKNERQVLDVDHVIICAGQEPLLELFQPVKDAGIKVHLIGGAEEARELDAKRAIDQGARLAAKL
ncbi:MAG: FAD-dependent oxidoreductase, partial [Bacteroidota bacterium]